MDYELSAQNHIYIVLGMARSGTRAITRGLKTLGIDLGDRLMPAEDQFNPTGVYEDIDIIYKVNRAVSYTLNYTWESIQIMDHLCRNNPQLDTLKQEAVSLLKQRFTTTQHWGFKDPRTCKIISFWQSVFSDLKLKEHYIIAVRHPLASAYSWHQLNEVDVEAALLSWLAHLISAIDGTMGKKRVFVSYDLMLKNPIAQLERMKNHLDIPLNADSIEIDNYANKFLDKKLKHHDYSEDAASHPVMKVSPICLKIYDLLMKVASDEISENSDAFSQGWQAIKTEFDQVYPIYCYLDTLFKKNKEQERKIRSMQKSLPWKLVYPIRLIDDALRVFRKKRVACSIK